MVICTRTAIKYARQLQLSKEMIGKFEYWDSTYIHWRQTGRKFLSNDMNCMTIKGPGLHDPEAWRVGKYYALCAACYRLYPQSRKRWAKSSWTMRHKPSTLHRSMPLRRLWGAEARQSHTALNSIICWYISQFSTSLAGSTDILLLLASTSFPEYLTSRDLQLKPER